MAEEDKKILLDKGGLRKLLSLIGDWLLDWQTKNVTPVSGGGTGATDADGARGNLNAASTDDIARVSRYLPRAAADNWNTVTDMLMVDLHNKESVPNLPTFVNTDNAATKLVNCPYTEASYFQALRIVDWYADSNLSVRLIEQFPTPGRVWQISFNNGAWDAWKVTCGVDSIVATGITGNWNWVKYASGRAVMYSLTPAHTLSFSNQYGAMNNYPSRLRCNYPFTLKTIYGVSTEAQQAGNLVMTNAAVVDLSYIEFWTYCPINKTQDQIYFRIMVEGTWK